MIELVEPLQYTTCRACGRRLDPVFDLGSQRLSEFRTDMSEPPRHPLRLMFCHGCLLGQLDTTVPPRQLYHDSYSFKSGVSEAIRADLTDVVTWTLARTRGRPGRGSWLDIACNDGTLLSNVPPAWLRYGIDPLPQFAREAQQHGQITTDLFHPRHYHPGQFDVVTSISMFYDLDNPVEFAQQVAQILAPGGVWVIQQNYLPQMLANNSIDNISHEHITYFTLNALRHVLDRAGLEICEVTASPINGGCIRTLVAHKASREVDWDTVGRMLDREQKLRRTVLWDEFRSRTADLLDRLERFVTHVNRAGRSVWVYGASTRGGTIWQAAGLDSTLLPAVVDRNPDKIGRYMSSIGSPIISEEQMRTDPPDYLLVGPWWFREQFIQREAEYLRRGGLLVFPLPEFEIVGAEALR